MVCIELTFPLQFTLMNDQVPCTLRALVTILAERIGVIDVSSFFQGNVWGQCC